MLKYAFLVCVAVATTFASPAFSDTISSGTAAMSDDFHDIRYSGTWNRDGRSGVYRIVVENGDSAAAADRLFVQWMTQDNSGQETVENSIEISEIAAWGLDIVDYVSESDSEGLVLFIDVINPRTNFGEEYELFVFGPNEYRLGTSTN